MSVFCMSRWIAGLFIGESLLITGGRRVRYNANFIIRSCVQVMAPLPTEFIKSYNMPEPSSRASVSEGKKAASATKAEKETERTVKPVIKEGVLEYCMPLRGDFSVE